MGDRAVRDMDDDTNDGPSSAALGCVQHPNNQRTKQVVYDYLQYKLHQNRLHWSACPELAEPSAINQAVRKMTTEFDTKFGAAMGQMDLPVSEETVEATFREVANELFSDGPQWGRIVALLSFGGNVAVQMANKNAYVAVDNIANFIHMYLEGELGVWIDEHGSWEGFMEFYQVNNGRAIYSDVPWPSLGKFFCGVAAGALGALTIGAFLTSR